MLWFVSTVTGEKGTSPALQAVGCLLVSGGAHIEGQVQGKQQLLQEGQRLVLQTTQHAHLSDGKSHEKSNGSMLNGQMTRLGSGSKQNMSLLHSLSITVQVQLTC